MAPIRAALLSLALLSGCGALGAVSDASAPLDAYTLTPYAPGGIPATGRRHLVVELPTSGGALATDRILIKPVPFQAQYLPDGRWSEPTPALLQSLLVASFQNAGGFRLVGRTGAGLMPDYTLMTEIQSFQAEPAGPTAGPVIIRIALMMTVIRESDRQIIAARPFTGSASTASDETAAVVAGFDSALQSVLRDAVQWTAALAR